MMPRTLHTRVSAAACLLLLLSTACGRRTPHTARPLPPPTVTAAPVEPKHRPDVDPNPPQLSDAEKKAAARAAFSEGVELQEHKDCAGALPKFELAERMYDAPTHQLHIAQCQASTGRLIEAQETYATLAHLTLPAQAPAAFREAQSSGAKELARLKPRIPTLRLDTTPPAASLKNVVVQINGTQLPPDLLGIARPMNPGRYRVTVAAAPGRSGSSRCPTSSTTTNPLFAANAAASTGVQPVTKGSPRCATALAMYSPA